MDYIYLDTDERRRFAQVSHEYLIEQLQFTGDESTSTTSNKIKLNFKIGVQEQQEKPNAASCFNIKQRDIQIAGTFSEPLLLLSYRKIWEEPG